MDIQTRDRLNKVIMYVILTIMAFIMLVPFVWMILTAVKTNQEAISVAPFYIFPQKGWLQTPGHRSLSLYAGLFLP